MKTYTKINYTWKFYFQFDSSTLARDVELVGSVFELEDVFHEARLVRVFGRVVVLAQREHEEAVVAGNQIDDDQNGLKQNENVFNH